MPIYFQIYQTDGKKRVPNADNQIVIVQLVAIFPQSAEPPTDKKCAVNLFFITWGNSDSITLRAAFRDTFTNQVVYLFIIALVS